MQGPPTRDRSDAIEGWKTTITSSNPEIDGSCSRSTAVVCFQATVWLNDPAAVDRLVARNADGDIVVDRDIGDKEEEVVAEVAVFDYGESGEFTIQVVNNGTVVEKLTERVDCFTRENSTVSEVNDTDESVYLEGYGGGQATPSGMRFGFPVRNGLSTS